MRAGLREEERELMWKFRYSLTKETRALTKLLKCVDWSDQREVHQARAIVDQWAQGIPSPSAIWIPMEPVTLGFRRGDSTMTRNWTWEAPRVITTNRWG